MFVRWISAETGQNGGSLNQNNPNPFVNSVLGQVLVQVAGDKKEHRASQTLSLAFPHCQSQKFREFLLWSVHHLHLGAFVFLHKRHVVSQLCGSVGSYSPGGLSPEPAPLGFLCWGYL